MTVKTILPRRFSSADVIRQYARVAWFYDGWGRLTEDKALTRLLHFANIADGMNIVEVAMGTGRLFEKVVRLNPSGVNEGMDLSPIQGKSRVCILPLPITLCCRYATSGA